MSDFNEQDRKSVSNFYADLAILATRQGAGACGDPTRPCGETHAQRLALERGYIRATRHER